MISKLHGPKNFCRYQKNIVGKYNNITQIIDKTLNNNGPNIDPCGTPDNTSKGNA
jgi:hypothetical protein